ncbi:MAG TPA: hypothetical protein VF432_30160 [Thermoanaerobaculia bacterium]
MKTLATCTLALLLTGGTVLAQDNNISISLNSDDSRTELGDRHDVRDARMAITTRDRSTVLLLLDDTVAMQLTDATLAKMDAEKKKDTNFLEELVLAGVKLAVGKSVEYPIADIRTIDYSNGALRVIGADNKPVFTEIKVNGTDVLRDFSRADVVRFANAVRAAKSRK